MSFMSLDIRLSGILLGLGNGFPGLLLRLLLFDMQALNDGSMLGLSLHNPQLGLFSLLLCLDTETFNGLIALCLKVRDLLPGRLHQALDSGFRLFHTLDGLLSRLAFCSRFFLRRCACCLGGQMQGSFDTHVLLCCGNTSVSLVESCADLCRG